MIAEAGLAALWMAAAMALLQALLAILSVAGKRADLAGSTRSVAVVQAVLASAAMGCLVALFAGSDLSVALVAANSYAAMPAMQKVVATWLNDDGAAVLGVAMLSLAGGVAAMLGRRVDARMLDAALGIQAGIGLCCYAILLAKGQPFARLFPTPDAGDGLGPMLRDPGLSLHAPLLALGYAALAAAVAFAVAAIVTRARWEALVRATRPWLLAAWLCLTLDVGVVGPSFSAPIAPGALLAGAAALVLLDLFAVLAADEGAPWPRRPRIDRTALLKRATVPVAVASAALIVLLPFARGAGVLPVVVLVLAAGLAAASLAPLWQGQVGAIAPSAWGLMVAHLGIAVALAGLASADGFARETVAVVRQDNVQRVGPYWIRARGVRPVLGPDWSAVAVELEARRGQDGAPSILAPESRYFAASRTTIGERDRAQWIDGELSAALGQPDGKGGWQVRLTWRPFAGLVWFGGLLAALGAMVSLTAIGWRRRDDADDWDDES